MGRVSALHLVSRHEGQHTRARVRSVVACMLGSESADAWWRDRIDAVLCKVQCVGAVVVALARSWATDSGDAALLPI